MDTTILYTMILDIPFNEETTKQWDEDPIINQASIENDIQNIQRMIHKFGMVSTSRIFRAFGIEEQPEQPHIFVTEIREYEIYEAEDGGTCISIFLAGSFQQLIPPSKRQRQGGRHFAKPYILDPEKESRKLAEEYVTERDKNGKPIAGRYPFGKSIKHSYEEDPDTGERNQGTDFMPENESEDAVCQTGPKETSDSEEKGKT